VKPAGLKLTSCGFFCDLVMAKQNSKTMAAAISVGSNILLVALKLVIGVVTGSISILAEAVHSGVDLVAALIAYFAVRVADLPPDEQHPYGHGKYENISGTAEAMLIILAAIYIIYEAVVKIVVMAPIERPGLGFGILIMFLSTLANWLVSANLFKVARETDSIALEADAQHHRLDVYTSGAVLAGLLLVYMLMGHVKNAVLIDRLLGLGVGVWIGWIGFELSRKAVSPLLDAQLPAAELERIAEILHSEDLIIGYHKLRTRKAGAHRHVDVHLFLPPEMSLMDAHELADRVEDRIRAEFDNVYVLTHVEPADDHEHHDV